MRQYHVYLRFLDLLEKVILTLGFSVMLGITFLNIVDRKVAGILAERGMHLGLSWSLYEELTCALFLLVTLVGAAMAARRGLHLGLSLLTDKLPAKQQRYFSALAGLAGMFFSLMLAVFGLEMVQGEILMGMRTPALGWPEWVFGSFVPVGGVLLGLEFFNFIIYSFTKESEVWRS